MTSLSRRKRQTTLWITKPISRNLQGGRRPRLGSPDRIFLPSLFLVLFGGLIVSQGIVAADSSAAIGQKAQAVQPSDTATAQNQGENAQTHMEKPLRWLSPRADLASTASHPTVRANESDLKTRETAAPRTGPIRDSEGHDARAEERARLVVFQAPTAADLDDPLADPFGDRQLPGNSQERGASGGVPPRPVGQGGGTSGPEILPPPPPLAMPAVPTPLAAGQPVAEQAPGGPPATKAPGELLEAMPQAPPDQRPVEEQLAQVPGVGRDECPPFDRLKKISEITNNIAAKPGQFPVECPLQGERFEGRTWEPVVFAWTASALCHKPLYFEQVAVERYGHNLGPIIQPFASGAHFFLTIPILPYKMGLTPPDECMYPLGYYRPGSCAPRILDPFPLSVRAALAEGGFWTGLVFLIP